MVKSLNEQSENSKRPQTEIQEIQKIEAMNRKILGNLLSLKGLYVKHVVSRDTRLLTVIPTDGVLSGLRKDTLSACVWTHKAKVKGQSHCSSFQTSVGDSTTCLTGNPESSQ